MPIFLFVENKLIKYAYTKGLEKPRKLIVDHESTTKGLGYRVKHLITNILIQINGVKINDICPRNRAFFHSQDFHHLLRLKNCLKTFSH